MAYKKIKYGYIFQRIKKDGTVRSKNWNWRYYDESVGRQKIRSTGTDDETEARQIAADWAVEYLAKRKEKPNPRIENSNLTFSQISLDYYKSKIKTWGDKHAKDTKNIIKNILNPYFEDLDVSDIGAVEDAIEDFKTEQLEFVGTNTLNHRLTTLSQIFKHARKRYRDIIKQRPEIERCTVKESEAGRVLSIDEVNRMMSAAEEMNYDLVLFIALGFYAGLRPGEILRLEWHQLKFAGKVKVIELGRQKNGSLMKAPLPKPLIELLLKVPAEKRTGRIVCRTVSNQYQRNIKRIDTDKIYKTWYQCCQNAGIEEHTTPHDLRRTACTLWYEHMGDEGIGASRHKTVSAFKIYVRKQNERQIEKANTAYDNIQSDSALLAASDAFSTSQKSYPINFLPPGGIAR